MYFPAETVKREFIKESDHQTRCPWKGMASYYSLEVNGDLNENAAWYYPDPSTAASHIKDHKNEVPDLPQISGSRDFKGHRARRGRLIALRESNPVTHPIADG